MEYRHRLTQINTNLSLNLLRKGLCWNFLKPHSNLREMVIFCNNIGDSYLRHDYHCSQIGKGDPRLVLKLHSQSFCFLEFKVSHHRVHDQYLLLKTHAIHRLCISEWGLFVGLILTLPPSLFLLSSFFYLRIQYFTFLLNFHFT